MSLNELDHDGAIVTTDAGVTLRLRIEPDDFTELEPDEWGMVSPVRGLYDGAENRPRNFTGRACKVWARSDQFWWEPPADVQVGSDTYRKMLAKMPEMIEFGFNVIIVEVIDGTDAYGRPIVQDFGSLGGIEWDADAEHIREVAAELAHELLAVQA